MTKNPQGPPPCTEVEILIVGFGFASIPLLRILKERNQKYTIINSGQTIWQRLKAKDKLDFDLVSSFHASYYAEDQIKNGSVVDYYPTATEFYKYHEGIYEEFKDHVIEDFVTKVDNYSNHSIVHTASGVCYTAKNVVFATGLGRPQNDAILNWDYTSIRNKTVVINMGGDTANMMLAKLVPNGNKCILINNGFMALEKDWCYNSPSPGGLKFFIPILGARTGFKHRLDFANEECHTVGDIFPLYWNTWCHFAGSGPPGPDNWLSKTIWPHQFFIKFPETFRFDSVYRNHRAKRQVGYVNGPIGIKYHAIDMWEHRYAQDSTQLEQNIRQGHLMNDITFFMNEGLVENWKRNRTTIDRENKTISFRETDGTLKTVHYDQLIEGGQESPNLPPITSYNKEGEAHNYQYRFKESFLGSVPSRLNNVFFMGLVRPISGGAANMNEMQAMMIHKLLSDPEKKSELESSMHERIKVYNQKYYPDYEPDQHSPTDHLVFYGLYTRDVARFLGLHRPVLSTAFSWNPFKFISNLRFELLHPNNAIKYRLTGEYAVKGADKFLQGIFTHKDEQALVMRYQLSFLFDMWMGYLMIIMGCHELFQTLVNNNAGDGIVAAGGASALLCSALLYLFQEHLPIVFVLTASLPQVVSLGPKAHTQPFAMLYIALYGRWFWCLGVYAFFASIAFLSRQFYYFGWSGRYLFGDCKHKHLSRPFWEQYKTAFKKVCDEKASRKKCA